MRYVKKSGALSTANNEYMFSNGYQTNNKTITVNELTAMQVPAYSACVKLIANTMASLPMRLFDNRTGVKTEVTTGTTYYTISKRTQANPFVTPSEFLSLYGQTISVYGNFIALITKNTKGEIERIEVPDSPRNVSVTVLNNGDLEYDFTFEGNRRVVTSADNVIHVKDNTFQTRQGAGSLKYAREQLQLALDSNRTSMDLFSNRAVPGGILSLKRALKPEAAEKLEEQFQTKYSNASRGGTLVLHDDANFKPLEVDFEKSQLFQTRNQVSRDISMIMGIPYSLLTVGEKGINGNIQDLNRQLYQNCIQPLILKLEQALRLHLPTSRTIELDVSELLRADEKTRLEISNNLFKSGCLTINEYRQRHGLNPLEGANDILAIDTNNYTFGTLQQIIDGSNTNTNNDSEMINTDMNTDSNTDSNQDSTDRGNNDETDSTI